MMSYSANSYENRVSFEKNSVLVHEIHFSLGDILPDGLNYSEDGNVTLKVTMHYSDPFGRDRRKTFTLPSTTIL